MALDLDVNKYIEDIYHIEKWGQGYFKVNGEGNLSIQSTEENLDIYQVVKEIVDQDVELPVVVRFHDILRSQVISLNETFIKIMEEAGYKGQYRGVYPIKVNQMREVVEEILDAGAPYHFGLEAGSKAELLSVLSLNGDDKSLTILNGYKDKEFLKLALMGRKLGKQTVVVIEKYSELINLLNLSREMDVKPIIGIRARLSVMGSGKWSGSGGESAKFGLSIPEILNALNYLRKHDSLDCLKLIHFHVGSQITNIQTIKDVVSEGTRIYTELRKLGAPIEYLDVGGGLGVDYDGSQSTHDSSRNYNLENYVSDIVYGVKQLCDLENVEHPNIVTESGRFITAPHSCLITEVVDKIDYRENEYKNDTNTENEHILVKNIKELWRNISEEDRQESFNDALAIKSDCDNAFKLGVISIEEKAIIETNFWKICEWLKNKIGSMNFIPEEFENFSGKLSSQYLCNFSVFQSLPDNWAIGQLIPIVPITRLRELPTERCTIVDITCDSDGKIDKFINGGETSETLLLHNLKKNEPYYLGFFLTGAYQDVMGDMHNLFGRVNEVHVFSDAEDPNGFFIETVVKGNSNRQVLSSMQYNPDLMSYSLKKEVDRKVTEKKIPPREGVKLINFYEKCLEGYTYLKNH
ncbi:MAG: biosynthetic arginine decarboxylase [Deltaproteobacteria bacterium]|nr:MAG: biosynthetic arginine decarboxylase [Deltaproteobacteria bacterium]